MDPVLTASGVHIRPLQLVDLTDDVYNPSTSGEATQPYPSARRLLASDGTRWAVDGFTVAGGHSPYTAAAVVALSDAEDNGGGQLVVFPGSHVALNTATRNLMLNGSFIELAKFSDENANQKPDLCADGIQPVHLSLKAGDAVIFAGKLAYREEINFGVTPQSLVYFRVKHIDHDRLKVGALDKWHIEMAAMDGVAHVHAPAVASYAVQAPLPPPPSNQAAVSFAASPPDQAAAAVECAHPAQQNYLEEDNPVTLFHDMSIHSESMNPVHNQSYPPHI